MPLKDEYEESSSARHYLGYTVTGHHLGFPILSTIIHFMREF